MLKPAIHLNGTSPESLRDAYSATYDALSCALDKLCASAPNARDYYVLESGAWERAREEHEARLAAVRKVRDEIEELAVHCIEACDARRSS